MMCAVSGGVSHARAGGDTGALGASYSLTPSLTHTDTHTHTHVTVPCPDYYLFELTCHITP
jgi:hypothetical protein